MEEINKKALKFIFNTPIYHIEEEKLHSPKNDTLVRPEVEIKKNITVQTDKQKEDIQPKFFGIFASKDELSAYETLLHKILAATEIDPKKMQILPLDKFEGPQHFEHTLLFSNNPISVSGTNIKYELKQKDKSVVLWCDNLKEISQNIDKKKALWFGLKKMFGI